MAADHGERTPLAARARRWLFGSTEVTVGTIESDVPPPPPGAAEAGRAALARAAKVACDA